MADPAATASHPSAAETARQALRDGGGCVDAVIAGFFALAAIRPGALLSPLVAVVAGIGHGQHGYDGRAIQPGKGRQRPRGYQPQEAIDPASRIATPTGLGAISVLHAHAGSRPLRAAIRPATKLAKQGGADKRVQLFKALESGGAATFLNSNYLRYLLRAADAGSHRLLSEEDLRNALPGQSDLQFTTSHSGLDVGLATLKEGVGPCQRPAEVVVASDRRGLVAALACCPDDEGVPVPELEIRLCRDAIPVMRGVERIRPGSRLRAPLPLAILRDAKQGWYGALAASRRPAWLADEIGSTQPLAAMLDELVAAHPGAAAHVASSHKRTTRLLSTAEG